MDRSLAPSGNWQILLANYRSLVWATRLAGLPGAHWQIANLSTVNYNSRLSWFESKGINMFQ